MFSNPFIESFDNDFDSFLGPQLNFDFLEYEPKPLEPCDVANNLVFDNSPMSGDIGNQTSYDSVIKSASAVPIHGQAHGANFLHLFQHEHSHHQLQQQYHYHQAKDAVKVSQQPPHSSTVQEPNIQSNCSNDATTKSSKQAQMVAQEKKRKLSNSKPLIVKVKPLQQPQKFLDMLDAVDDSSPSSSSTSSEDEDSEYVPVASPNNCVAPSNINNQFQQQQQQQEKPIFNNGVDLLLRGARKLILEKIDNVKELNSLPYKYIFKLVIPLSLVDSCQTITHADISFELLCYENNTCSIIEEGIVIEKTAKTRLTSTTRELDFKVYLKAYSHNHNKALFAVQVYLHQELIFKSHPKSVFARRNRGSKANGGTRKRRSKQVMEECSDDE